MSAKAVENVGKELHGDPEPFDRPGFYAANAYSGSGSFDDGFEYSAAGLGYVRAKVGDLGAEARGPTVGVGFGDSESGLRAGVKAELASASATAGPVKATVGLAADTGFSAGQSGVGVQVLGTGVSIGRTTKISLFGSSLQWKWF